MEISLAFYCHLLGSVSDHVLTNRVNNERAFHQVIKYSNGTFRYITNQLTQGTKFYTEISSINFSLCCYCMASDCYQEINCNPKMQVVLFKLTTIDSFLIKALLLSSHKARAPKSTTLPRGFY